jgi:hypothetical protein
MTFASLAVILLGVLVILTLAVVGFVVAWRELRSPGRVASSHGLLPVPSTRELRKAARKFPPSSQARAIALRPLVPTTSRADLERMREIARMAQWNLGAPAKVNKLALSHAGTCPSRWESSPHRGHFQHACRLMAGHDGECQCWACENP